MNRNRQMFIVTSRVLGEVSLALQKTTGKRLWNVSETNRLKLYNLWIWHKRYSVSLDYILSVLVPYFSHGVEKRTGIRSKGLGISISVLTGVVAKEYLQKCISRDFTDGDHLALSREAERDNIIAMLEPVPEFRTRVKTSLQYKSISAETKAYIHRIDKVIKKDSKIANQLKKIPWRGNPFI